MNNFKNLAISSIAIFSLIGCQPEDSTAINCQHEIIEVDEIQYCVYHSPITETGFDCPLDFAHLFEFDEFAVCGPDPQMPPEHEAYFNEGFPIDPSSDPDQGPDGEAITEYDEITGHPPLYDEVEFCEVILAYEHAAHFNVERIYTDSQQSGIFLELEVLNDWDTSIDDTILARISGGPVPGDENVFQAPQLSITKGEDVVVFFDPPSEVSDVVDIALSLALFRPLIDGDFTNGVHFNEEGISVNDLQGLVDDTRNSPEECETE